MKNKTISLKSIVLNFVVICVIGAIFGNLIFYMLRDWLHMDQVNITICIILFIIFLGILWLPLTLDIMGCTSIDENCISMMPSYSHFKKLDIIRYVILHNDITPFLRRIPINSIQSCTFTFSRKWGAYAYSRYTLQLILHLQDEVVTLYINPMENGVLLPSDQGGVAFLHIKTHEEIVNMVQYFITAGVEVKDPYKLLEALKDPNLVLYDYLESFHKKILF